LATNAPAEIIAAGGGTLTDTLHIAWAVMTLLFNMLLMGLWGSCIGKAISPVYDSDMGNLYHIRCFDLYGVSRH
jgi:hypothetical protein